MNNINFFRVLGWLFALWVMLLALVIVAVQCPALDASFAARRVWFLCKALPVTAGTAIAIMSAIDSIVHANKITRGRE